MDYKKQQAKFDKAKWMDSVVAGYDKCGEYDFCVKCDKSLENPCARAAYKYKRAETVKVATVRRTRTVKSK